MTPINDKDLVSSMSKVFIPALSMGCNAHRPVSAKVPFIPPFPSFPPLRESRGVAKTTVTGLLRFCGTLPGNTWMDLQHKKKIQKCFNNVSCLILANIITYIAILLYMLYMLHMQSMILCFKWQATVHIVHNPLGIVNLGSFAQLENGSM